ncbi:MAG: DUF3224 domain-containing protein [Candidatus Dormiibacterota bacterium]
MDNTITQATGTFEIEGWDANVYDDGDVSSLSRVTLTKHYQGDLVGEGTTTLLTASAAHDSAAYVGLERFSGRLLGREGSFVLSHGAIAERGIGGSVTATVVPDSGTGDLVLLRGVLTITIDEQGAHHYALEVARPLA